MSRTTRQLAFVCSLLLLTASMGAETIRSKDLEVTVRPDGCGLIDEVKYKGEVVISSGVSSHAPVPGYVSGKERATDAAKLAAKLLTLNANAPCTVTESTSKRGHKLVTLENGLVKVTAMTWFGGRIIRFESKLTGANLLDNPYEDRPDEVKGPKDMAGLWGELSDGIFRLKVVTKTADEVAVTLTGEGKDVRIEKTLRLRRGAATLEVAQKRTNTGEEPHGSDNHLFGRFRVGRAAGPEDVLWGSSRGRATRPGRRRSSPNCHTDPRVDRWAALCDVDEGVTLVGVHAGPVVRIGTWIQPGFYQLELRTPEHFTLAPGKSMTTTWTLASCVNLGGVAFADADVALSIVPSADVMPAHAKTWSTSVAAAGLSAGSRTLTLRARLVDRHGARVKDLAAVTVPCPFLVAQPRRVDWPVGDLAAGRYDMHLIVEADGKKLGTTVLRFERADAGPVLEVFEPDAAEKDAVFPVLGTARRAKVHLTSVVKTAPTTIRVTGKHLLDGTESPYVAEIMLNASGDGFDVRHTLTCNATGRVRAAGLALPLVLGSDWYKVRTTVGGERLNDTWRVDQQDEVVRTYTISDWFSRWPLWKLGGVLQESPTHYRIYKASDVDVAPMTTLHGTAAPGWVELSNNKRGIRIAMTDMAAKAPKAIVANGYTGATHVWFYPPQSPPIALASSGDPAAPSAADRLKWKRGAAWPNTVSVRFHAGPHLRGFKRDVSDKAFRAALEALGDPTVPRSMPEFALPGRTLEACIQNVLDSELTCRDYLRRSIRGSRLRALCQKLGCAYIRGNDEKTVDGIVETLKEKYP